MTLSCTATPFLDCAEVCMAQPGSAGGWQDTALISHEPAELSLTRRRLRAQTSLQMEKRTSLHQGVTTTFYKLPD